MDQEIRQLIRAHLYGLWERRWRVVAVAWTICALGWTAVAVLPNRYESFARVYVDTSTLLRPLMQDLAVRPDVEQQVDVVRRTLLSRPNLEQLMRMTDMDLTVTTPVEQDTRIKELQRDIQLKSEGGQLFTVSYEHRDPAVAQRVVQALLNIFVEQNVGSNRRDMESARRFIEQQIRDHEKRLRETEQRVAEFRTRHAAQLATHDEIKTAAEEAATELRRVELQLEAAMWTRDQLRFELSRTPDALKPDRLLGAGPSADPAAAPNPQATTLRQMEEQLASLQATKTPRHPDVIALKRRIEAFRSEIAGNPAAPDGAGTGTVANPAYVRAQENLRRAELEVATLTKRADARREEVQSLRRQITALPDINLQLAEVNRDYDVVRKNYDELVQRRESAELAEKLASQTKNVEFRIVDPPIVPVKPSGPKRVLFFAAVLFLGLGAAVGLSVLTTQLKDSFGSAERLRNRFDLPVLGAVSAVVLDVSPVVRALEIAMVATMGALLLSMFAFLVYLFQFAAVPPDIYSHVARIVAELRLLWT
ncbi:XrtA system polysaccharide chain length determinant [Arenibaculum pallidiluteum]|uniref:XrtA system polysaccharide chain length determinant n=1 Tax=Arenibaculum pallidiluteum TaxID=2812559 RepID=UPI001A9596FF|nr:XrtA system polysaccharide chain length determinant [Arenibaculum pallidiluteum]